MNTSISKMITTAYCAITLYGCTGSPVHIASMSKYGLQSTSTSALCNAWSFFGHKNPDDIYSEIVRREVIPADEIRVAQRGKIRIGMSELGLYCAWGFPDDINESNYGSGTEKQFIYGRGTYVKTTYVYTKHGVITAWN